MLDFGNIPGNLEDKVEIAYEKTAASMFEKILEESKKEAKKMDKTR